VVFWVKLGIQGKSEKLKVKSEKLWFFTFSFSLLVFHFLIVSINLAVVNYSAWKVGDFLYLYTL